MPQASTDDPDWAEIVREGDALLGRVTAQFDEVEWYLYLIFEKLLGLPRPVVWPLFYSHQTVRSQRDMLDSVAGVILASNPSELEKLRVLIRRIGVSAGRRNAIVHATWYRIESDHVGKQLIRAAISRDGDNWLNMASGQNLDQRTAETKRYDFAKLRRVINELAGLTSDLQEFWMSSPSLLRPAPR